MTKRAYELFLSSEVEEKRQLVKLVLSNLRIEDGKVQYSLIKPFDAIVNCSVSQLWLPLVDMFSSRTLQLEVSHVNLKTLLQNIQIEKVSIA